MKAVWKEFFRLKRQEIGDWFKYHCPNLIKECLWSIPTVVHMTISTMMFAILIFNPGSLNGFNEYVGLSFLIWPCIFLIYMVSVIIPWIANNWKQAKFNVNYKERQNEKQ